LRKKKISQEVPSPQVLVDCSKNYLGGCDGGWPEYSFDYIKKHGIANEKTYPYVAQKQPCAYNKSLSDIPDNLISEIHNVPVNGNETLMKNIVAAVGPVSIAMCTDLSFQFYRGGFFDDENCCTDLDHGRQNLLNKFI
jgi:hypothetical protein